MNADPVNQDLTSLRSAAEMRLGQTPAVEPVEAAPEALLHELQVQQIELEMQNETLRQAQSALEESRDRYVDLYDFSPVGYITLTCEAMVLEINLTGAALLGEQRGKLANRRFARFVVAEDRDHWNRHFLRVVTKGNKHRFEVELKRVDGSRFNAQLDCLRMDRNDAAPVVRIALTDITERKRAEEELRIAATTFETQDGMMVTDSEGVVLRVNKAFTRMTGYSAEEILGKKPSILKSGRHDSAFYRSMWETLKREGYWQGQIWNRLKNGKVTSEWQTISAVTTPDGRTTHYVCAYTDITRSPEAEAEIYRLAYHDALTNLPNRRLLQDRLNQALVASGRSGHFGAVLFLDLDNFKMLNDTRGHDIGDQLLVKVAMRLNASVREGDTVARLGGDEFVLLLEDLSSEEEAAALQAKLVGEKARQSLAQPFHLKNDQYLCTTSIGIKMFRDGTMTVDDLLKHADLAMYQSKNAGRNTLCFFDPAMQTVLDERSVLEADLRLALERKQFRLYFQPQMENASGIVGAEALIRWEHPERGLILPGDFISLAEETRLILPIGLWVLETACAQLKAWEDSPLTIALRLSVNVSAIQFHQPDFVFQVRRVLQESGANPYRLKIELTEGLVLDDVTDSITKMQALRAIGVGFSMDDFGTGYSSLSYLTRLPLDQIKIDQSFIHDIGSHDIGVNPSRVVIVQTIISMGHTLGLDVIAEGVEAEEQRDFLGSTGCHSYQGYLYSHPLPLVEFEQFMRLH